LIKVNHLSSLQGLFTSITQIPICLSVPLPPLLLSLEEDACAFTIIADTDNENRPSAINENKNTNVALLLVLHLFMGFLVVETAVKLKDHILNPSFLFLIPLMSDDHDRY
jgi:hypothetical protein